MEMKKSVWPYVWAEATCVFLFCGVLAGGIYMLANAMRGGGCLVALACVCVVTGKWGTAALPKAETDD